MSTREILIIYITGLVVSIIYDQALRLSGYKPYAVGLIGIIFDLLLWFITLPGSLILVIMFPERVNPKKPETVHEWEYRNRKKYPSDAPVWWRQRNNPNDPFWNLSLYNDYLSRDHEILVADHRGKPPLTFKKPSNGREKK